MTPSTKIGVAELRDPGQLSRVLTAHFMNHIGIHGFVVTASWTVLERAESAVLVTAVFAATYAPRFIFTLPCAALADHFGHKRVAAIGQSVTATSTALVAGVTLVAVPSPPFIVLASALVGTGVAVGVSANQALVAEVAGTASLPRAMALSSSAVGVARAVGPLLAGLALTTSGTQYAFLLPAIAALCSLALLATVSKNREKTPTAHSDLGSIPGQLRVVFIYMNSTPGYSGLLGMTLTFSVLSAGVQALLPILASDALSLEAGGFSVLLAAFGLGGVLVAIWRQMGSERRRSVPVPWIICGFGVCMLATGLAGTHFHAVVLLLVILGAGWVLIISTLNAAVQSDSPPEFRARVISVFLLAFNGFVPIGALMAGQLADLLGVLVAMRVLGAGLCASGLLFVWRSRHVSSTLTGFGWGRITELPDWPHHV